MEPAAGTGEYMTVTTDFSTQLSKTWMKPSDEAS
jgi:hypothetical protein